MPVIVKKVAECCELGEAPHWDVQTQSLYYVDVFGKSIHKYTPSTKTHTKAIIGTDTVSFIIPVEGAANEYLVSIGRQIARITWDGISEKVSDIQKIAEVDTSPDTVPNRINDAKCDVSGRLWYGTMGPELEIGKVGKITPNRGSLFSLSPEGEVKTHVKPVSESNGLAWNSDNTKMYYIDSQAKEIHQYNFDLTNGTISNKTVVFTLEDDTTFFDGQTIDTDGNLWVAVFNAHKVIKIDPRKYNTLLQTIDIPAKQITSVTFGGQNLDELYVTSASITIGGVELSPPDHGAVFKVTGLSVKGHSAVRAKIL